MKAKRILVLWHQQHPNADRVGVVRALALGLPGGVAIVFLVPPPVGVPAIALAINPAILLCAAAFAGSFAAPRLGLRSATLLGDALPARPLFYQQFSRRRRDPVPPARGRCCSSLRLRSLPHRC